MIRTSKMATRPPALASAAAMLLAAGMLLAPGCGDSTSDDAGGKGGKGGGGGDENLCGNGFVDPDLGEECDDDNLDDTDDCLSSCIMARCGDGIVWANVEQCDDGNTDDSDGCLQTCVAAGCGDGIVQVGVEQCDDGNEEDSDACSSTCTPGSGCGNGAVEAGEQCDDGNQSNADDCLKDCSTATCGDGYAHIGFEECDDGNSINDDNCTTDCKLSEFATFDCPGQPLMLSANGEISTPGNTTGLDSNYQGSCGGDGAPEIVYAVTPPSNGTMIVDMSGLSAASDPVLYVAKDDCLSGPEVGCADSSFGGGTESLNIPVTAGTPYYIFADGWNGTEGEFILTINLLTTVPGDDCPGIPVTLNANQSVTLSGNTAVAEAQRVGLGECAWGATPEIVYQVTPNANGKLVGALDPTYDGALYVRSNCTSQASQLACSEETSGGGLEVVQIPVTAGSKYWFFADGFGGDSGPYDIEFTLLPP